MTEEKRRKNREFIFLLLLCTTGVLCLAVSGMLILFSDIPVFIPVGAGLLVFIAVGAVLIVSSLRSSSDVEPETDRSVQTMIADVLKKLDIPVVITTLEGRIVWANSLMTAVCGTEGGMTGKNVSEYAGVQMSELISAGLPGGAGVMLCGKECRALSYIMPTGDRDFWLTVFVDRSELAEAERKIDAESPVLVYAVIDNLEQLAQYVKVSYREAVNKTETMLREWTAKLGGLIREYDRDKYFIAFPKNRLSECVEDGFAILDRIRRIGLDNTGMSVTVSMGVSVCGSNLLEREADAASALETALQRGGDQAVLKTPDGPNAFFGGKTKTDLNRTRIISRTVCGRLIQLIGSAGNVLIMGHKNPDFDCIGGCVGLARLSLTFNNDVHVVVNKNDSNFRIAASVLRRDNPEYDGIFVGGGEALDMIRSDTLLIIADVNNLRIVEEPDIAANVATQVIIDHHRKAADFAIEPAITCIEPGTSSCCELVTEMLETLSGTSSPSGIISLTPSEANLLLAGIMLDTKNFTRSTGEETFAAAYFLRSCGAVSDVVNTFFFNEERDFVSEARLGANLKRFRDKFAITADRVEGDGGRITPGDRVAASRAAEALLEVRNVEAAFAMVYTDSEVLISGRSRGTVNVQLILEQLGGGGRYDAAGAQISGTGFQLVSEQLKEAIDSYLEDAGGATAAD